jgi:hypothetical protein
MCSVACPGCGYCRVVEGQTVSLTVRFPVDSAADLERLRQQLGARSASEVMRRALCLLRRTVDGVQE